MGGLGKAGTPGSLKDLMSISHGMINRTRGPRNMLIDQMAQALGTGQAKAKIPLIQQAVSQSNQATSNALRQTSEQLAQRNIGGVFGSRILAQQRQAGEQHTAALPTSMAEQMISQTMPFLASTQSLGVGGLGQGAQMQTQMNEFNAQQQIALIGALGKAISPGGMMSGMMGGKG